MSILLIKQCRPWLYTISVAESKWVYCTLKSSLAMPSLIEEPHGWERSIINLRDPSFFSLDPRGEQCKSGHGATLKGPDV